MSARGPVDSLFAQTGTAMSLFPHQVCRRSFLQSGGVSLGSMALTDLLRSSAVQALDRTDTQAQRWNGMLNPLPKAPRAKRIIWLYMAGGMTHIDTFDNKPKLAELHGTPMPESITKGPADCPAAGTATDLLCTAASVSPVGAVRAVAG
jgi:hypothetical protein